MFPWPTEIEPTVSRGTITLLRMPLSSEDSDVVISLLQRNSPLTLERRIFKGTSFGYPERLSLQYADCWLAVILRLPEVTIKRTIGIVARPEPLIPFQTNESILGEIYRPILPTEAELKLIGGNLLGLLRNPEPSKLSLQISESGSP